MEEKPGWKYKSDSGDSQLAKVDDDTPVAALPRDAEMQAEVGEIEWTASEFIEHKKPVWWYLTLTAVIVVIAILVYLSSRDYVAVAGVIAAGILFAVIAARKPRSLNYRLDNKGLTVAEKVYPYNHFKAFWTTREGIASSLNFMPLRRFMPVLTVYYDPDDEDKIISVMGSYLPLGSPRKDIIDKFLKKIRF